jgi:multiple sugar transport system permease protein
MARTVRWPVDPSTAADASRVPARRLMLPRRLRQRSVLAFLLCVPLFVIIGGFVLYPAVFAVYLAMLNKAQTTFVGFANFKFLLGRDLFWMVVQQVIVFAVTAVFFKAILGFIAAHLVNNLPQKGQRKWRGMMLVPWVIPPALSTLGWWWMFDPTYSAFNWLLALFGGPHIAWLSEPNWARFCVILVNIWIGTPFFMIMYLAALKSVPAELYEVAAVDGATAWQKLVYVTLPMMRNIISVTVLFSLIVTFANYDIVRVLTAGGPRNMTHILATYAFRLGIESGDIPLGASVSLVMLPILGVFAVFILRGVRQRAREL